MTLAEYYGFPEGTKAFMQYANFYDIQENNYPYPSNMHYAYSGETRTVVKPIDTSNVTDMGSMFSGCSKLKTAPLLDTSNVTAMGSMFYGCSTLISVPQFDTSNVTDMKQMFYKCISLTSVPQFDTSNVTDMNTMFSGCYYLTSIPQFDTSNVTDMNQMFSGCDVLRKLPPMDCSKITANYPLFITSTAGYEHLTDVGGFLNIKSSWTGSYGLPKCPNLTYESCINILNGLYDFTGNGQTPTSSQGKLKVHKNFLTAVGDEISIGTNKGWTITT